jgi:hypothetical protein
VFAPLLAPIAISLGIDPIHFGIIMTVNLAIGMFTPPFGLNIFVAQSVTGLPAHALYRGVAPFVAVLVLALLVITYVPALSLTSVRNPRKGNLMLSTLLKAVTLGAAVTLMPLAAAQAQSTMKLARRQSTTSSTNGRRFSPRNCRRASATR